MSPALDAVPVPGVTVVTFSEVGGADGTLTLGTEAGVVAGTSDMSVTLPSAGVVVAAEPPEEALLLSSPPQARSDALSTTAATTGARGERRRIDIAAGTYCQKVRDTLMLHVL